MILDQRHCQRCGSAIPEERLEALPETLICVRCSEAIGGEYQAVGVLVNVGKAGSLKRNYGGLRVEKRWKRIERLAREQGPAGGG